MASGLLNVYVAEPDRRDEVQRSLREVSRRALSASVSPSHTPTGPTTRRDDENLFWSHLALVLGIDRYVRCDGKPCADDADEDRVQERLVRHLLARTLASGVFHARSFPGSPMWPADQTVTLLAIKLYDATHGTSLHEVPLRGFLGVVGGRADPRTGLFPSSLSPIENAPIPRGCATSWSVFYLAQLDIHVAFDQYTRERAWLREDVLGVGGFREWPRGRGGGMNVDSGPIVLGVGIAATGLGLGPARLFRDAESYAVIRRTALLFGAPAWWRSGGYMAAPLLGRRSCSTGERREPGSDRRLPRTLTRRPRRSRPRSSHSATSCSSRGVCARSRVSSARGSASALGFALVSDSPETKHSRSREYQVIRSFPFTRLSLDALCSSGCVSRSSGESLHDRSARAADLFSQGALRESIRWDVVALHVPPSPRRGRGCPGVRRGRRRSDPWRLDRHRR